MVEQKHREYFFGSTRLFLALVNDRTTGEGKVVLGDAALVGAEYFEYGRHSPKDFNGADKKWPKQVIHLLNATTNDSSYSYEREEVLETKERPDLCIYEITHPEREAGRIYGRAAHQLDKMQRAYDKKLDETKRAGKHQKAAEGTALLNLAAINVARDFLQGYDILDDGKGTLEKALARRILDFARKVAPDGKINPPSPGGREK